VHVFACWTALVTTPSAPVSVVLYSNVALGVPLGAVHRKLNVSADGV